MKQLKKNEELRSKKRKKKLVQKHLKLENNIMNQLKKNKTQKSLNFKK